MDPPLGFIVIRHFHTFYARDHRGASGFIGQHRILPDITVRRIFGSMNTFQIPGKIVSVSNRVPQRLATNYQIKH
jgi:hypothetical protein